MSYRSEELSSSPLMCASQVYHSKHHMYLVGSHREGARFGILRFNRHDGAQLQCLEHPIQYDAKQVNQILRNLHTTNAHHGGLVFVTKAVGVLGCIRFTACHYLMLLTKKSFVGSICGEAVPIRAEVALALTLPICPS